MRNVLIVLIIVLASSVALADGPTVAFKYVDSHGTLSFTDDAQKVPEKFKAEKVTLGRLGDYDRFTAVTDVKISATLITVAAAPLVVAAPVVTPIVTDCGKVSVRSERRSIKTNSGGSNARIFIAEDDCGILFDAPSYPELNALRR